MAFCIDEFATAEVFFSHLAAQEGSKSSTVEHTVILNKDRFPTKAAARDWVKSHGFKTETVRETTNSWRFRQRPPEDFAQDSFRTVKATNGVSIVVGHLK
jgi:hypothetical protein